MQAETTTLPSKPGPWRPRCEFLLLVITTAGDIQRDGSKAKTCSYAKASSDISTETAPSETGGLDLQLFGRSFTSSAQEATEPPTLPPHEHPLQMTSTCRQPRKKMYMEIRCENMQTCSGPICGARKESPLQRPCLPKLFRLQELKACC